jgi:hypothetical protein
MKKTLFTLLSICILANTIAQEVPEYKRSSLSMILLESEDFPFKDVVIKTYNSHPFPDKYNEHNLDDKKFAIDNVNLTEADLVAAGFYKDTLNNPLKITAAEAKSQKTGQTVRYLNDEKTLAVMDPNKQKQVPAKILKFINDKQIGKQIAASWFNIKDDGSYNLDTIAARGKYSASQDAKDQAGLGADNLETALYDEALLGNTFTIFNKMKFVENEPIARAIRDLGKEAIKAKMKEPLLTPALNALDLAYELAKEGYSVWTTSFLYQFDWSKETAEQFKFNYLDSDDFAKNWKKDTVCKLKFIGSSKATSVIMLPVDGKTSPDEAIKRGVDRNIDKVFAKLQKKYPAFRPSVKIFSVGPVKAQIGLKDGVEKGQSYGILQWDPKAKDGMGDYVQKGKVKVDKNFPIWDNRAGANDSINATTFKGGKKLMGYEYLKLIK